MSASSANATSVLARTGTIAVIDVTEQPNVFEVRGRGPQSVVRLSAAEVPGKLVSTIFNELERLAEI